MTFDYSPGWIGALAQCDFVSPLAPARQTAPTHPTAPELAQILKELLVEGALSRSQFSQMNECLEADTL